MAVTAPLDDAYRVISTAFDGAFYRAVNPDLADADIDPLHHYLASGWREGRDPAPWFSTRAYVKANPEVAKAGINPLHHYLTQGRREGREVVRSAFADSYLRRRARRDIEPEWRFESLIGAAPEDPLPEPAANDEMAPVVEDEVEFDPVFHRDKMLVGVEFDAAFYAAAHPDVVAGGADPLDHFMLTGWREGRDPNMAFSVKDYLESYLDVAAAGINPFVHYLTAGRAEGRAARVQLGFRYEMLKRLAPLDGQVAAVAEASARLKPKPASQLARGLAESRTGLSDLHLTFSHDDYTANTGGVQLCLQREDARIEALGRDHMHLFPAKPWRVVREAGEPGPLGVLLNGRPLGAFSARTVAKALGAAAGAAKPGVRSLAIHSLLGHDPDEVADIAGAAGLTSGFFWLHDFASLCAGFHLLRNEVEDCSAPPPESAACGVCIYGPWRARHTRGHARLFERLALSVVSPSQPTLDLWKASSAYPTTGEVVLPHARLVPRRAAPAVPEGRPLRVAYAGMPAAHKGWEIFRDLVERFAGDPRYAFLHLGGASPPGLPLTFHRVVVTDENPRAMQQAIAKASVDVVVIWPLCRETFSFIAYEAVAGGAAVIAGPDSGNVAAFVESGGHGLVLTSEAALAEAFAEGEVAALSRAVRKPRLYDLAFSGLTVDLLEDRA